MEENNISSTDECKEEKANTEGQSLPPAKKSKKNKYLLFGCLGVMFLTIIIIVLSVLWVFSALFDDKPLEEVAKNPDPDKMVSIAEKFGIDQKESGDQQEMVMQLLNTLMETSKTVTLSKEETNALLDYAVVGGREYLKQKFPSVSLSNAYFDNGCLYVAASYKNTFSTPFGQYLNMKITIIPGVKENHISLSVKNLEVGSITVSGNSLQTKLDEGIADFEKTKDGKMFLEVVSHLDVKQESVTITFNPQKMTMTLLNSMGAGQDKGGLDADALMQMLQ